MNLTDLAHSVDREMTDMYSIESFVDRDIFPQFDQFFARVENCPWQYEIYLKCSALKSRVQLCTYQCTIQFIEILFCNFFTLHDKTHSLHQPF